MPFRMQKIYLVLANRRQKAPAGLAPVRTVISVTVWTFNYSNNLLHVSFTDIAPYQIFTYASCPRICLFYSLYASYYDKINVLYTLIQSECHDRSDKVMVFVMALTK